MKFWNSENSMIFYNFEKSEFSMFWARFRLFLRPDSNSAWKIIQFHGFKPIFRQNSKKKSPWGSPGGSFPPLPPATAARINRLRALTSQREGMRINTCSTSKLLRWMYSGLVTSQVFRVQGVLFMVWWFESQSIRLPSRLVPYWCPTYYQKSTIKDSPKHLKINSSPAT